MTARRLTLVMLLAAGAPGAGHAAAAPPAATPAAAPPAPVAKVAARGILGRVVLGPDGRAVGRVVDVLVDAGSNPRAAVLDCGGFLGVGTRRIAVNWSDLAFPPVRADGQAAPITLDLTSEQITAAPEYTDQDRPATVVEPPPAPSTLAKPDAAAGH